MLQETLSTENMSPALWGLLWWSAYGHMCVCVYAYVMGAIVTWRLIIASNIPHHRQTMWRRCWSMCLSVAVSWHTVCLRVELIFAVVAGRLEILMSQWEREGWGWRRKRREGEGVALNAAAPVFIVLLWLVERRAEEARGERESLQSRSEVTHGWVFIFRAAN